MSAAMPSLRRAVIVADNDAMLRSILRTVLTDARQDVVLAEDGMAALALAHRFVARLVLLDVAMPRMDGLTACQQIRGLPGYAEVPIVILTGYDRPDLRAAAIRAGATQFLTKPFQVEPFLLALAPYLDLPETRKTADGGRAAAAGQPWAVRAQVWDRRPEPRRIFGEPAELERGRTMLGIQRGAPPPERS